MGVYIRGMEMPTSCDDCEFCKRDISGYDWCCIPMMSGRSKPLDEPVTKPDWCPLVPIPPHSRLIDADVLQTDYFVPSTASGMPNYYYVSKKQIDEAQTIIPAEEGE